MNKGIFIGSLSITGILKGKTPWQIFRRLISELTTLLRQVGNETRRARKGAVSRDGIVKAERPVVPIFLSVFPCGPIGAPRRVVRRAGDLSERCLVGMTRTVNQFDRRIFERFDKPTLDGPGIEDRIRLRPNVTSECG